MKLYTKEMFLTAAEKCEVSMIDAKHNMQYIDEYVTPIELPTMSNNETHPDDFIHGKLTKREYFASIMPVDDYTYDTVRPLMDSDIPRSPDLERMKWWMLVEAKIKVMKADALIKALTNEHASKF
jgi:hypothetical protein